MSHLYEAFVDIREYSEQDSMPPRIFTDRYEVDADSRGDADKAALSKAEGIHPKATELDVRITRILH